MKAAIFDFFGLQLKRVLPQCKFDRTANFSKNLVLVVSFWWVAIFGLGACSSGVEIERIDPAQLIAVSSFISPQDSLVRVYVSQGKALGAIVNSNTAVISDAQVSISDGLSTQILTFDSKTQSYVIANKILKITALKTYDLKVKTKDGVSVNATCQVPSVVQGFSLDGNRSENDYVFGFNWKLPENLRYFFYGLDVTNVRFVPKLGQVNGPSVPIFGSNILIDSKDLPKKQNSHVIFNSFLAETVSLKTTTYGLDENAYKYLKTKQEASSYEGNIDNFFPNLQEPQPVYSNINGGVGVFGAANKSEYITVIK